MRSGAPVIAFALACVGGFADVSIGQIGCPETHTCRVTIVDPLRWLKAGLTSDALRDAVRSGPLGEVLALAGVEESLVPSNIWRQIVLFRDVVPQEVTIACPPTAFSALGNLWRASFADSLLAAADYCERIPEKKLENIRAELQKEFEEGVAGSLGVELSATIRCRTARVADDWWDAVAAFVRSLRNDESEPPTVEDDRLSLRLPIEGFVGEFVAGMFEGMQIEGAMVDEMWSRLDQCSLRFDMRQDDERLVFALKLEGERAAPDKPLADAVAVPELEGDEILTFQGDASGFADEVGRCAELWRRYRKTEVGSQLLSFDASGSADDLQLLADRLRRFARVAGALSFDQRCVRYAVDTPTRGAIRGVDSDAIWRLIPDSTAWFHVDGSSTLAETAYDLMLRWEDLRTRYYNLRSIGGASNAEQADADLDAYFHRAKRLRELVRVEGGRVLEGPSLMLVDLPQVPMGSLERTTGFAAAGRLRAGANGLAYLRKVAVESAQVAGLEGDVDSDALGRALQLGVPTVAFPMKQAIGLEPVDLRPHGFVVDGYLVISSSVSVSKSILRSRGCESPSITPKPPGTIAAGATNGVRLAGCVASVGADLGRLMGSSQDGAIVTVGAWTNLVGCALSDLLRLFAGCEFETTRCERVQRSRGRFAFRSDQREQELQSLIKKVRAALGPWPARADALSARGVCRYRDDDGTFTFTCGKDGHFHNRIKAVASEEHVWTGASAWSNNDSRAPRTLDDEWRRMLITFDAVWSGQWVDAPGGMEIRFAPDWLPGTPPELLLSFPEAGCCTRVWVDRESHLPAAYAQRAAARGFVDPIRMRDYRKVRGRMLPYEVATDGQEGFHVKSWKVATLRPGKPVRPRAPAAPQMVGDPDVEFDTDGGGRVRVKAGGKQVWLRFSLAAPTTRISRRALREMGCNVADDDHWASVGKLKVGPMVLRDLVVEVARDPVSTDDDESTTVHGVIGRAIATRACVEMDFQQRSMQLFPPGSFADREAEFVDVGYFEGCPTVPLRFDKDTVVDVPLFIVTMSPKLVIGANHQLEGYRVSRAGLRVVGPLTARTARVVARLDGLSLAGQPLPEMPLLWPLLRGAGVVGPQETVSLGTPMFQEDFVLLLDLPSERVAFVPR